MLNARKIMTKVFSKLTDLPKEIIEHYGHKESDGMIIFSPPERFRRENATYFCTKCGTKGETAGEFPVCSNCGNTAFRPPINDERSYQSEGCKFCGKRNSYHQRDKEYIFHLIDAVETDDDGIVIRVQAVIRDRVFA